MWLLSDVLYHEWSVFGASQNDVKITSLLILARSRGGDTIFEE